MGVLLEAGELRADVGEVLQGDFLRAGRRIRQPFFGLFVEFEAHADQPADPFGVVAGGDRQHRGAALETGFDPVCDRFLLGFFGFIGGVRGFLFGDLRLRLRGRLLQRRGRVVRGAQQFGGGDRHGALFGDRFGLLLGMGFDFFQCIFALRLVAAAARFRGFIKRSAAALQARDAADRFPADFFFCVPVVFAGLFLGRLLALREQRGQLRRFLGDRAVAGFDGFSQCFQRFGVEHMLAFAEQFFPFGEDALFAGRRPERVAGFPERPVCGGQFARGP